MHISDIGSNIIAIKQVYITETKVKKWLKTNKDLESTHKDLQKLYDWAKTNNIVFN